ncbi:MAG: adenylyltransferase/cytidyltransferase family protein, partial [Patescibacteria group bacterium]
MNQNNKVILVTGVFDLLHPEHIEFLKKSKALGGELIVGVETDERVGQMKGVGRPIQPAGQRVKQIMELGLADQVVVLPIEFDQPQHHQQ